MRIRILSFAVAAVMAISSSAHAQRGGDFIGGVLGGATLADFGGVNSGSRWGGTAGLFGAWRSSRNSVGMLEVNWTQKGDEFTRINYIEVPLTGGAVVPTSGGGTFRLYAGINAAFKVACSASAATVSNCDLTKSPIWSIPFGVMIGRTSRSGTVVAVDVRYDVALTDTFSNRVVWNRAWYFRILLGKGRRR